MFLFPTHIGMLKQSQKLRENKESQESTMLTIGRCCGDISLDQERRIQNDQFVSCIFDQICHFNALRDVAWYTPHKLPASKLPYSLQQPVYGGYLGVSFAELFSGKNHEFFADAFYVWHPPVCATTTNKGSYHYYMEVKLITQVCGKFQLNWLNLRILNMCTYNCKIFCSPCYSFKEFSQAGQQRYRSPVFCFLFVFSRLWDHLYCSCLPCLRKVSQLLDSIENFGKIFYCGFWQSLQHAVADLIFTRC